jgi:hypothetical protein
MIRRGPYILEAPWGSQFWSPLMTQSLSWRGLLKDIYPKLRPSLCGLSWCENEGLGQFEKDEVYYGLLFTGGILMPFPCMSRTPAGL